MKASKSIYSSVMQFLCSLRGVVVTRVREVRRLRMLGCIVVAHNVGCSCC